MGSSTSIFSVNGGLAKAAPLSGLPRAHPALAGDHRPLTQNDDQQFAGAALHDRNLPSRVCQPAWLGSPVDREPASRSRLHTRNRYPLAKSQRFRPRRACRDDHSVRLHQSSCQRDQLADITGAAHDDALEATLELTEQVLDSALHDVGSFEFQLTYRAQEKRRSTPARFDERDLEFAADDLDREPREARARAEVDQCSERRWEEREEKQAIEEQMFHDPHRIGRTDDPVNLLPLNQ